MARYRAALLIVLLCGCAAHPVEPPTASSIVLCKDLRWGAAAWESEVAKRFYRPIVVCVHGGTMFGQWWCEPDDSPEMNVEAMALLLKKLYPDRPIFLISCNREGIPLHVRGVFYAKSIVSSYPGRGEKSWAKTARDFVEGH